MYWHLICFIVVDCVPNITDVYHDSGREGQIASNGSEVEGGDGGHKSLQRAVPHQVQGLPGPLTDGLILEQLFGKIAVESEEVDQLRR